MIFNSNKSRQEQQKEHKRLAGLAAAKALAELPLEDMVLGIGTGSTLDILIQNIPENIKSRLRKPVAVSSQASKKILDEYNISYESDTNLINGIDLYLDGADEVDDYGRMIKGGGGALTGEKILAAQAKEFWCLVDQSKLVKLLGEFPVAVEVTQMARSLISREILKIGGNPEYRIGFVSDYGNPIVDVHGLDLTNPSKMETTLNNLPGCLTNGIFARNRATKIFWGGVDDVSGEAAAKQIIPK
ncbi:MAG: ribose-5-phosphate isomerase RpiA [Candidatus Portiera sp.]|nr:ribose-5-phosphate isomerase RpiA [Portiera sp.]